MRRENASRSSGHCASHPHNSTAAVSAAIQTAGCQRRRQRQFRALRSRSPPASSSAQSGQKGKNTRGKGATLSSSAIGMGSSQIAARADQSQLYLRRSKASSEPVAGISSIAKL